MKYITAIIDTAIDRKNHAKHLKELEFFMIDSGEMIQLKESRLLENPSHGGECIRYFEDGSQSCADYFILLQSTEDGVCNLHDLVTSLNWCIVNGVSLISLSMGTTQYSDSAEFAGTMNCMHKNGICLIAGASNSRKLSYPACFDECIGVCHDYTNATIKGQFAYIENPYDGIEVVLNPKASSVAFIDSTSMATAYFAGLVAKAIKDGDTKPSEVKKWIASTGEKLNAKAIYDYTRNSIFYDYTEDVVVVALSTEKKTLAFRRELQKLFLENKYFCLSLFASENVVQKNNLFNHEFIRVTNNRDSSYEDYVELMIKLCEPNLILIDLNEYEAPTDVIISKTVQTGRKGDVFMLNLEQNTPQETFEQIVSHFESDKDSETDDIKDNHDQ
ncbi:MAG: hypothetical protein FWC13_06745 [Oscillospiraceae bacterium]|nr:hypothetical protein [Oscillospiraceae bacterium]